MKRKKDDVFEFYNDPLVDSINETVIKKIIMPKDGGIYRYPLGIKYPIKGLQSKRAISDIRIVKNIIVNFSRLATDNVIRFSIIIFLILPYFLTEKTILNILESFGHFTERILGRNYLKNERLCISGRAIYRIGNELANIVPDCQGIEYKLKLTIERITMALCTIWEYDYPYRYIGQDIFSELNIVSLKENPEKEIMRLFDILIERNQVGWMKTKFKRIKLLTLLLIKHKRKWIKKIVEIINEEDIKNLSLDQADTYYASLITNYNCKGLSLDDRILLRKKLNKKQ
jgi:hypothetical protein